MTTDPKTTVAPVEATPEMIDAFYHSEGPVGPYRIVSWSVATAMARGNVFRHLDEIFVNAYRAMLAAAPSLSDRREEIAQIIRCHVGYVPHPWDIAREGSITGADQAADAILSLLQGGEGGK